MMNFHGKVVMEDGSPPGRLVAILRKCAGATPMREANTSPKTGEYYLRLYVSDYGSVLSGRNRYADLIACYLEAEAPGLASTRIDLSDRRISKNPQLPDLVLSRKPPEALVDLNRTDPIPGAARKPWERALKALAANNWPEAETALRAVVASAPAFAPAWSALGAACQNQRKSAESRTALERAAALDSKRLPVLMALASVQLELKDWPAAANTSQSLIDADTEHTYLEAYLTNAIARFQQKDLDGALSRMNELLNLDKRGDLPRAEYILGIILEAKGDLAGAGSHLKKYLDGHPRAADAAVVSERLANLGKQPPADLSSESGSADIRLAASGEAPVPGGIKAFSVIARLPVAATYQDFFLQYCRALTSGTAAGASTTAEAVRDIRTFLSSMSDFERLGERAGDRITVRLAVDTPAHRQITATALTLLGWRLRENGEGYSVEPGDQAVDGLRQRIPGALGIDELAMRYSIAAGRPFQFEIPIETARLVGGAAWTATLKDRPEATLGPLEIFSRDRRFARVYAAIAAMEPETATAVVSGVGLLPLITRLSGLLGEFSEALSVAGERAAVPGGMKAEAAWTALAGVAPSAPPTFFRALFEKDNGLLLAFFFDLSRADAAHQQFFTASPARAQAFYRMYQTTAGLTGPPSASARWQAAILQHLRLSANGSAELPGGGSEEELLRLPSLEPMAALITLEHKRANPLDRDSAQLLAQHYQEWRHLFPYFESLPALAGPQFKALAAFAESAAAAAPAERAVTVGTWHSLVELIVLGTRAGSLSAAQAADLFAKTCEVLSSSRAPSRVGEIVGALAGGRADIDEGIASSLLRLPAGRRGSYEHVMALQHVPRFGALGAAPDSRKLLEALAGAVYAAVLDPTLLLVAEDPQLLAKHDFLYTPGKTAGLFAQSGLEVSNRAPGSYLTGGFATLEEVAKNLAGRTIGGETPADSGAEAPAGGNATSAPATAASEPAASGTTDTIFRAAGRIVEVYATVTDGRGRYIDDLKQGDFTIQVEGKPTPLFAFENHMASVSVALLFDTTGSMTATLPSLKRAAMNLVDELRPDDAVAVYGFNDVVTEFQPFTTDKVAVKRALLRAHPSGPTALYDALVRVNRDLAQRKGKKVIIVFTDGDDNSSLLPADTAILRAKSHGIPIYTIAQGAAIDNQRLLSQLENLSQLTGGASFLIRKLGDIGAVFEKMSQDLMHGYLLAFQPPPGDDNTWRKIAVAVSSRKGLVIRAREGYLAE